MGVDSDSPLGRGWSAEKKQTQKEKPLVGRGFVPLPFPARLRTAGSGLPLSCVDGSQSFKVNLRRAPLCCAVASRRVSHRLARVVLRTEARLCVRHRAQCGVAQGRPGGS